MEGPPLGPGGEDITWPDQVAPRGRKASSTRKIKRQTSNLQRRPLPPPWVVWRAHLARSRHWALVGPFHVVRAPPRVRPRSLALSGVLWGGRSGPGSPLRGLACTPCGGCVTRGWWGAVPGGGGHLPLL